MIVHIFNRYYMQMFLAQVVIYSPQLIPSEFQSPIHDFMDSFLKMADYQVIRAMEVESQDLWCSLLPFVQPIYVPELTSNNEALTKLHMLSLQTVLLSLQNMLGRDDHREVLCKDSLEDYITFMPAHVPISLREQAEELVRIAGIFRPPRLVNLAKARLAKMHFSTQTIIQMPVGEIVALFS